MRERGFRNSRTEEFGAAAHGRERLRETEIDAPMEGDLAARQKFREIIKVYAVSDYLK
ncbi:hypothetical protein KP509_14G090900 [Ceratopteris richardii]|uniref:Uncharacterized protein n=1 Tax=Ceratopteris richardii TaxID=49495 RepID=A0A8T2TFE7_CERRI|nr:hypothetical protein KP509_14G090900 [Ceratopteris richardii]